MDIAKCMLDEKIYTTLEFSKLPPGELSAKRKQLVCVECQAPAFFRKASRKGHAACFGALPHFDRCSLSLASTQCVKEESISRSVGAYSNEPITFDLPSTTPSDIGGWLATTKKLIEAREVIFSSEDLKHGPLLHRQLSDTLKYLILTEKIRASTQEVFPESEVSIDQSHFFISFEKAELDQSEKIRGYWGMLTDARLSGEGALWLNSGGRADISCVIRAEMVDEFFERYSLEDEEDLAGGYVAVVGTVKISQAGKKYIILSDIDHMDLISAQLNRNIEDEFFLNKKARTAFLLIHNQLGVFDNELGIKRKHYIDKNAAKQWKARLASQFHPDKNLDDLSIDYNEVISCINKTYNRMVGEA